MVVAAKNTPRTLVKGYASNGCKANFKRGTDVADFPEELHDGQPVEQPLAICGRRRVLQNGSPAEQILVQWVGGSPDEATWEWLSEFQTTYPTYNLEDKVVFEDGGNDTSLEEHGVRASKRVSVAPGWHKDFVMG
ncbi:ty3-gypsy retrotransposon protein [Tanacetum coccineum]